MDLCWVETRIQYEIYYSRERAEDNNVRAVIKGKQNLLKSEIWNSITNEN